MEGETGVGRRAAGNIDEVRTIKMDSHVRFGSRGEIDKASDHQNHRETQNAPAGIEIPVARQKSVTRRSTRFPSC
jgi:hypothetical protein